MLEWHWREEKVSHSDYFRLTELDEDELMDEAAGLAGLSFDGPAQGGTKQCPVHRYRFPVQEAAVRKQDDVKMPGGLSFGKVEAIDTQACTVNITKRKDTANTHPTALFAHTTVRTGELSSALFRLGQWVADTGVDTPGSFRAARDLLLARGPRLRHAASATAALQRDGESSVAAACRLALELDGGVLAIQGPPGAGKTYTAARMIRTLVRAGKNVGITAVSHKVIRNLLEGIVEAANEDGAPIRCLQKVKDKPSSDDEQPIRETTKNADVLKALQSQSGQVAAGTAWLWAREDMCESIDVLFVDEAGQMSLANVLAVAQAARNVVLLGDPQQLEQPLRASHPDGTEVSALHHLLEGKQTIPAKRGLFLDETWRMHPVICQLTSELFYEGRLHPRPDLAQQAITTRSAFTGSGLWFVPVAHEGHQNASPEEVEAVAEIYAMLTSPGATWTDREGNTLPLTEQEILIVAPYNAQVGALGARLPNARIGTVDKFQGQEAPVVIYSMATSSPDEAPRGMEFLFSQNRLNVATSRARCACILVASPKLFELDCRTPRQVQLANGFCRYLELAKDFSATPTS